MKNLLALLLVTLTFSAYAHDETRKLKLSSKGIESMTIDCGAGFLVVRGEGDEIEVSAVIRIDGMGKSDAKEFIERYVRLDLMKNGSTAELESRIDYNGDWDGSDMGIDITLKIPKNIDLRIHDGSGAITISDLKSDIELTDGSGEININDVDGNVRIKDGSGSIELRNIGGNVRVDDGSGSMTLTEIGGNVDVSDGSGSIDIDGVKRDVLIRNSGRGGVHIANVKGVVRRDNR